MKNNSTFSKLIILHLGFLLVYTPTFAQYTDTPHRELVAGEIPVSGPGNYGVPGTTYVLVKDITSATSTVFLGNNVTLDLNGYTISYADGNYEHIPNYSFEEGLTKWDFSKAPNAKIEDTKVNVFVGDKILRLKAGEEITSEYINLPIANRSYFAMCGIIKNTMKVTIYVENEYGQTVGCINRYGNGQMQGCPLFNKNPNLGGGFVYAHLKGIAAGKYRIKIKANTDCLIDHIDLRPSMDVGIGIVKKTSTYAHSDHLNETWYTNAFYDYTENFSQETPLAGIPIVESSGNIVIKNGVIKSEATGILSYGIQSTSTEVDIVLDNIKFVTQGINTIAASVSHATITNCLIDVNSPFIINRHGASYYGIDLYGSKASNVSLCHFYGGQGCLSSKGKYSKIHDNFFANRQTVTNHYSIMAMGDGSKIYNNIFEPEIGSGIEIYKHNNIEIFNNEFTIVAAGPSCEYGHEDYSTNGIRIADYKSGLCYNNKIYDNKFHITGKDYPEYHDFIPIATAIFYSASGSGNSVYNNELIVDALNPNSKAETVAFYIGGGSIGGEFYNNKITSNVPSFWIGSMYGNAVDTKVNTNEIIKAANANENYKPIRLGFSSRLAQNIEFRSNTIIDSDFDFDATQKDHTYSVYWTFKVNYQDPNGNAIGNENVKIADKNGAVVFEQKTSEEGTVSTELLEYAFLNRQKYMKSPYTVTVADKSEVVDLNKNTEIIINSDFASGIDLPDGNKDRMFSFAPNPFSTNIELSFSENESERSITIMGIDKKIHKSISTSSNTLTLDLSFLPSGLYLLNVIEDGVIHTTKMIKQ